MASNGQLSLSVLDEGGKLFRRRGIAGLSIRPVGEQILPQLNQLAGELLARLDMPAAELSARLADLVTQATPREPVHLEWAVAELNGVRVYTDGTQVVVTTRDLNI